MTLGSFTSHECQRRGGRLEKLNTVINTVILQTKKWLNIRGLGGGGGGVNDRILSYYVSSQQKSNVVKPLNTRVTVICK